MYYNGKSCEIINVRDEYCDILLPERNVELKSLSPISRISSELIENEYAIYVKNEYMEIVYVTKIDVTYDYAFVQIYKSNVLCSSLIHHHH